MLRFCLLFVSVLLASCTGVPLSGSLSTSGSDSQINSEPEPTVQANQPSVPETVIKEESENTEDISKDDNSEDDNPDADANDKDQTGDTAQVAAPAVLTVNGSSFDFDLGRTITPIGFAQDSCDQCSYKISPELPSGLSFNAQSLQITGLPATMVQNTNFTLTSENSAGKQEVTFQLAVGTEVLDLANPTKHTGAFPVIVGNGPVLHHNGKVYKFGGDYGGDWHCQGANSGYHIFSADEDDITSWTDHGVKLPARAGYLMISAVVGDHLYIFYNSCGSNIMKAPLSNLIDGWVDTGVALAVSPSVDSSGEVFVIGDTVYLFGSGAADDEIWTAPVSDPLTWTNTNIKLPQSARASNILETADYLYMVTVVGGNNLLRAAKSAPTVWESLGAVTTAAGNNSAKFVVGTKGYIFGGWGDSKIYSSELSTPTVWSDTTHSMPSPGHWGRSSHLRVGNSLLLIGGMPSDPVGYKGVNYVLEYTISRVYQ